jgi:hypothetical protein
MTALANLITSANTAAIAEDDATFEPAVNAMFAAADAIISKGVSTPGEAEALLRFVEFTSGIGPDQAKALQAVRAYLRQ